MFASEFRQYRENLKRNLERAVQSQYRIFVNIARNLYAPSLYTSRHSPPTHRSPKKHYYNRNRRKH